MSELPLPPASRQLGTSGIAVSPIAWGMWRLAEDGRKAADAARLVHAALDAGITFLDTADIYGFDGSSGFGDAEALLEAAGYEARVFEFISPEHTSKNLMISAVRRTAPQDTAEATRRAVALAAFYGIRNQRLAHLLRIPLAA